MQRGSVKEKATVTVSQKLSMGFGDLGYSMVSNTMSSFIMYFGNTVMGVPGTLMGVAIACGTMWDAVTDPLLGYVSDNTRSKYMGRRHIFILIGAVLMALINVMLWSVPKDWSVVAKFFWFVIGIIALETSHTLFATPNSALSIEISSNYNERSNIQAYKSIFAILGLLLPTLLMSVFQKPTEAYPDGRFNPSAYMNFSYIASSSIILFGIIMFMSTFSHIPRLREFSAMEKRSESRNGLKEIFRSFFFTLKDKNFRSVILGYSVSMMASTIIVTYGFNAFTFTFKTSTMQMYIIMAGLFLMTIVGQPLWLHISRKYNKKSAMILGLAVALVGCIMLFIMFLLKDYFNGLLLKNSLNVIFMMPPLMVAGLGIGVMFSMPLALMGDTMVIEKAVTGVDKTATYTGFMTLAYKASQAVSQLVLGALLDIVGFKEGSATQTPSVENALGWMMCVGVTVSVLGGLLIFTRYRTTRKEVQAALDKISNIAENNQ